MGIFGDNKQVTANSQFQPATERTAVERSDGWLGELVYFAIGVILGNQFALKYLAIGPGKLRELPNIRTGAKCSLPYSRQDQYTN